MSSTEVPAEVPNAPPDANALEQADVAVTRAVAPASDTSTSVLLCASSLTSTVALTAGPQMRAASSLTFSAIAMSRSAGLKILPTAVTGSASIAMMLRGRAGGSWTCRSRWA